MFFQTDGSIPQSFFHTNHYPVIGMIQTAGREVEAKSPDAECMRGAVWAPQAVDGADRFVSAALEQLTTDAEDEEMVETVSCAWACARARVYVFARARVCVYECARARVCVFMCVCLCVRVCPR